MDAGVIGMGVVAVKDGGPAFPIPNDDRPGSYEAHPGMTLRDYFAGQALAALIRVYPELDPWDSAGAPRAYAFADAMLKAREES